MTSDQHSTYYFYFLNFSFNPNKTLRKNKKEIRYTIKQSCANMMIQLMTQARMCWANKSQEIKLQENKNKAKLCEHGNGLIDVDIYM